MSQSQVSDGIDFYSFLRCSVANCLVCLSSVGWVVTGRRDERSGILLLGSFGLRRGLSRVWFKACTGAVIGTGGSGDPAIEPVESVCEALTRFVGIICEHEDESSSDLFPSADATIAFETMPVPFIDAELFEEGAGQVTGGVVRQSGQGWILEFGLPEGGLVAGFGCGGFGGRCGGGFDGIDGMDRIDRVR